MTKLTLPSGIVATLRASEPVPRSRRLFDDALAAVSASTDLDVLSLPLADFHVLRAVLTKRGVLEEEEARFPCANCGHELVVHPCRALEIGPWVDGELDDEELDVTLPFGEPVTVPELPLGRVRTAKTVTFAPRTVAQAKPLFAAITEGPLRIDEALVQALGVVAVGSERSPVRIAQALAAADDEAFGAVADAFVESHYAPRLSAIVRCPECDARNDVEAPLSREFTAEPRRTPPVDDGAFPDLDTFAARADAIAQGLQESEATRDVVVVIEDGVAAVDEGGEPLLGSYVPPQPPAPPTVTVYYRTFRAIHVEEGPYDWEAELAETLEHELEHHVYFLRGDDPMDDEERQVIRDEAVRVVGRKEASRRELAGFGASLGDFASRTWPLWLLALVALLVTLWSQR